MLALVRGGLGAAAARAQQRWSTVGATVARLATPTDANLYGNVHGGRLLWWCEQAGYIIATRHANAGRAAGALPLAAATVRLERMAFIQPMFIGEVARLSGSLTFTSKHTIQVTVDVTAENPLTGELRHTNRAQLWYIAGAACDAVPQPGRLHVPGAAERHFAPEPVPEYVPVTDKEKERFAAAELAYWRRREQQTMQADDSAGGSSLPATIPADAPTPSQSSASLIHLMGATELNELGVVHGGLLMKLMDEAAAIAAFRHTGTNVVTAEVGELNLEAPVHAGDLVHIRAQVAYASSRSLHILVEATKEDPRFQERTVKAVSATFTFVSLDEDGRPLPVTPVRPETEQERAQWVRGHARYLERKAAKAAKKKAAEAAS